MEVLKDIEKIISWYNEKCHTAPIESLLAVQDKLVTLAWYLAQEAAEMKHNYNIAYFTRKIAVSKQKQNLMIKMSGVRAEAEAITMNKDELFSEQEQEAMAYKLDLLLRQTNRVVSAIAQRISYLKNEKTQINIVS